MNCRERQIIAARCGIVTNTYEYLIVEQWRNANTRRMLILLKISFTKVYDHYEYLIESAMHHHECQQGDNPSAIT